MCTGFELASLALAMAGGVASADQARKAGNAQEAALKAVKPPPVAQAPQTPRKQLNTGGFGSTLITGPQGLAAGSQNLGASTLLGQ